MKFSLALAFVVIAAVAAPSQSSDPLPDPLDLSMDLANKLATDEEFQERFIGSFGVLSEREPPLSEVEVVLLEKVREMLKVNIEYARAMTEGILTDDHQASATFNYLLGNLYYGSEQYVLAEREYEKAIEKFPDFRRAWTNLGVLKLRSDDYAAALEAFSHSVALGSIDPSTYGKMAFCHFMLGNFMSAEAAYTLAIMNDPQNLRWLEGKVEVYMASERYEEAANLIDELIRARPTEAVYWLTQSNAHLAIGNVEAAANSIEIARKLGRADTDSLYQLGELYVALHLNHLAVERLSEAYRQATEQQPQRIIEAALAISGQGDTRHATLLLDLIETEPSALAPVNRSLYHRLSATLAEQRGNRQEAIESWSEFLELNPLDGIAMLKLVQLYADGGQRDRAYLMSERAATDERVRFQALMARAKLLVEDKRFQEALAPLSQAIELNASENLRNLYVRVKQASENT